MLAAPNNNTDSEDEDYVPPAHEQVSDSDESDHEREEVDKASQKIVEGDPEERKRKRDVLWAEFQASVSNPHPSKPQPFSSGMIKIEKKYRFAGDEVTEVVEVPEDSPEAKKWPIWNPDSDSNTTSQLDSTCFVVAQAEANPNEAMLSIDSATKSQNRFASVIPKPGLGKRPGPRKPKTILASLPASKPKKITTLDKSAMDWRAHIHSEEGMGSSLQDELEAHRKAGGYLEKVEFLKRVEERKEENIDLLKSKRRKL